MKTYYFLLICNLCLILFIQSSSNYNNQCPSTASNCDNYKMRIEEEKLKIKAVIGKDRFKIREVQQNKNPEVRYVHNFLQEGEADYVIEKFTEKLRRSYIMQDGNYIAISSVRTSRSGGIPKKADSVITTIEERIAKFTNSTLDQMENIQLLNYKHTQQFKNHFDWFNENNTETEGGQRLHTVLIYLSNIPREFGGGTTFPLLNVTIQPKKNDMVYFSNLYANGTGDPLSLHSGDQLLTDITEKWAITSWIRRVGEVFRGKNKTK